MIFRGGWSRPHRSPRRRAGALALVIGAAGLGFAPAADATGTSTVTHTADHQDTRTEADAMDEARRTGKPVEVTSLRTEKQEVVANPSGTLTLTQHAQPVRARKNGRLVPVDATLERAGSRIAPKATTLKVTFSGGGDTTLATLTAQDRKLSLQWPEKLPAPQLSENEATYPEVLPGVDLKVRATAETVGQVLVVKNAEAAENPKLKQFHLGIEAEGLRIEEDEEAGTLRALNPAGQELFASATPRMWDSSKEEQGNGDDQQDGRDSQVALRTLAAATVPSGDLEPGVKSADVDMSYAGGKLTLTPDQSLLTGKDTTFPVYIDPTFGGVRQAWTIAYKPAPNSSFWNGSGWGGSGKKTTEARVGYERETGGTARSFFQMDSRSLAGAEVIKAQFTIVNTHSWTCTAMPVEIWDTGRISSATTWNKQPNWSRKIETKNFSHGNESVGCADKGVDFNVTSTARDAARNKWPNMTLGLRASNESDTSSWKKFNSNPKLIVEYNRAPNAPTAYGSNPSVDCHADPYPAIGNTDVQLHATIRDPDGGTLDARFIMWRTGVTGNVFDETVSVTSGSVAKVTVPKSTFKDRTSYSWQVRAEDGRTVSAWTPNPPCRFTVYKERPSFRPAVSSKEYPIAHDGGDAPEWGAPARTTGTFTLANGGSKDVVKYVYGLDQKNPTSVAAPSSPGGSVDVKLTPSHAGPHVVYAYSEDRAGNRSDTGAYLFYASGAGVKDKPGDLNGDGHPDKWATDFDGKLYMYPGTGNGAFGSRLVAAESGFKDTLLTRRGDHTQDGYEDLVARHPDGKLWIYANTGFGAVDTENRQEMEGFDTQLDTAKIDQLVGAGDISGDGHPDLLARVGDSVWLLVGHPYGYITEAYPIADSGWAKRTLIAPGDMTGDGPIDLMARDDADGKIYLYRGEADEETGGTKPASLVNGAPSVYGASNWHSTNRPMLITPGDANGDGVPDLWAVTADGQNGDLLYHPSRPGSFVDGTPVKVGWGYKSIASLA
ncbi:DNRLRE domain-containing protein [Streptomyces sp. NPDC001339]|uniref:DNRLRE domain-containing protein n=1 Tax=Streptomyces sp. NPDC001339 TaxID=3364563 RepID=UPI0036768909